MAERGRGVDRELWRELGQAIWSRHRGKLLGTAGGFLLGVLIMWVGLFWAIFIGALTVAGYLLGQRLDEEPEGITDLLERMLHGRH